jgi:hypothetical protein
MSEGLDINVRRRHAQIQIALLMIGKQLGYRVWIARNDKGILYKGRKLGEIEGVIATLEDVKLMQVYEKAIKAALMIDCVWFKNDKLMPAVMEVEHTTGVTRGLTRMKGLFDILPALQQTRYVIVAPDEEKGKVITEANKPQFKDLNTRFFSYSSVEELYSLCQRRRLKGVTEEFLDCFMEPTLKTPGGHELPFVQN